MTKEKDSLYMMPVKAGIEGNSFSVEIETNMDHSKASGFACHVYADDYFLMCKSDGENLPTVKKGRICLDMKSLYVWLPGHYRLIFSIPDDMLGLMNFQIDNHQHVEFLGFGSYSVFAPEDIACSFFGSDADWETLATMPGTKEIRQAALEDRRQQLWSDVISMQVKEQVRQPSGYLFTCDGNENPAPAIRCLHRLLMLKAEIDITDSNQLYDSALQNPLDGLNNLLNNLPLGATVCLDKVGALTGNGGRFIIKKLTEAVRNGRFNLWLCGTKKEVESLLNMYPSLMEFFPEAKRLRFLQPTLQEMVQNFFFQLNNWDFHPTEETSRQLVLAIRKGYEDGTITNWTTADINHFYQEQVMPTYIKRLADTAEDFSKDELRTSDVNFSLLYGRTSDYEGCMNELNQMVGLDNIKKGITSLAHQVKIFTERRQLGLPTSNKDISHAVFTGNPGTGKTTVAKMLGRIYHHLGVLSKGEVIAVDRSRIVGRFIGDTEDNVKSLLKEARGNVLFIDEAYTLYGSEGSNDYGRRAIECLLTALTEENADMLVIFAGYKEEMDRLMTINPGLQGRFPYKYHFADYTAEQLMQIAENIFAKDKYLLTLDARRELQLSIEKALKHRSRHFGNARWIEQYVYNGIIPAFADRLAESEATRKLSREDYQRVEASDIRTAFELFNTSTQELKPRLKVVGFSA